MLAEATMFSILMSTSVKLKPPIKFLKVVSKN